MFYEELQGDMNINMCRKTLQVIVGVNITQNSLVTKQNHYCFIWKYS